MILSKKLKKKIVLVFCYSIIYCKPEGFVVKTLSKHLTVSVGQEFKNGLVEQFQLGISHEVTARCQLGQQKSKGLMGQRIRFECACSHDWQLGLAVGTEASVLFHMSLSSVLLDCPYNRLPVSPRVSHLREEG